MRGCASTLAMFGGLFLHPAKHRHAELAMGHFAAAEAHGDLHLVAFLEELEDLLHLGVIIVVVDVRTHLDLLDLLRLLLLALLVGLFLGLIFVAADIEELGDRRIGVGRDFDQVEADFLRLLERFAREHHAQIFAVFVDHPDLLGLDELVVAGAGELRRRLRSARIGRGYSRSPICCCERATLGARAPVEKVRRARSASFFAATCGEEVVSLALRGCRSERSPTRHGVVSLHNG